MELHGSKGERAEDRVVADELAYMMSRSSAHERLAAAASNDITRAVHRDLQRRYDEQAIRLRLVDRDHFQAQEY